MCIRDSPVRKVQPRRIPCQFDSLHNDLCLGHRDGKSHDSFSHGTGSDPDPAAAEAARVAERDHISADAVAAKIKKVNHERAVHCKHFTKTDWGNVKNYDLCIKSDDFGVKDTAKIIRELFQKKRAREIISVNSTL